MALFKRQRPAPVSAATAPTLTEDERAESQARDALLKLNIAIADAVYVILTSETRPPAGPKIADILTAINEPRVVTEGALSVVCPSVVDQPTGNHLPDYQISVIAAEDYTLDDIHIARGERVSLGVPVSGAVPAETLLIVSEMADAIREARIGLQVRAEVLNTARAQQAERDELAQTGREAVRSVLATRAVESL